MIRPLKIVNTRGMFCDIKNHSGEILAKNIKLSKHGIKKLMFYPITAFGYDLNDFKIVSKGVEENPKFSKHDVIRALDFWIEHWVYQNQLEATFTDTVNVDHEITLKELILVRESIMKMPADTKFTRERIKEPNDEANNFEYMDQDTGRYYHFKAKYRQVTTNMSAEQIKAAENIMKQKFPTTELPKMSKKKVVFTQAVYCEDSSLDPFCHMVLELTPEEYIKYKNKPYATGQIKYNFSEELLLGVQNSGGLFTNAMAAAMSSVQRSMEDLAAALNNVVPVPPTRFSERAFNDLQDAINLIGADFPVGVPITTIRGLDDVISSRTDTITYVNMHYISNGQPIMTDPNSFITIPVTFNGSGVEINTDIFLQSGDMIDKLTSWNNHRIQIRPALRNFLEIDGEEYHCVNMNISHNPSIPFSMHLRDLWIESTTSEASGAGTKLEINFQTTMGLTRMNISLTLDNPSGSGFMRTDIDDMNNRQWNLEILGNNRVRIGEDDFTVTEPIQINMR